MLKMNLLTIIRNFFFGAPAVSETQPPQAPEPVPSATQSILADTMWMEARSDGKQGMIAVANVVCNRAAQPGWWGTTIAGVCLKPYQFSSWNSGSTQLPLLESAKKNGDPDYALALNLAGLAVKGILPDTTGGADWYYATSMTTPPSWAKDEVFTVQIGQQRFYKAGPDAGVG